MEKYSTKQLPSVLFLYMFEIADTIVSNKNIFPGNPTEYDYEKLIHYAYALYKVHDEINGKNLNDNIFFDALIEFYSSLIEKGIFTKEDDKERIMNADVSIDAFLYDHLKFLKNSNNTDNLIQYTSDILSKIPSCEEIKPYSAAGIEFASLLPKIIEIVSQNYNALLSSWDKSLDVVEEPSVQSNDDFIVETYPKETPQISTTQPQQKNESAENKKMRTIFLILVLIGCFAASIYFYTENTALEKEIKHLEFLLSQAEYREKNKIETVNQYKKRIDSMSDEYEFYHKYAVIVTETGYRYHRYGCQHIEGRSFWIYNIAAAKGEGYTPCLDCNPPQ